MARRPDLEERLRRDRSCALFVETRSRRGEQFFEHARALLEARGLRVAEARAVGDSATLVRAVHGAVEGGLPLVVVGGGDGTLRAVLPCLAHRDVALGLLPLGTANNFARSLGIPMRLEGAIAACVSGRVVSVDLARCNGELFANVVVIGYDAAVTRATPPSLKRRLGMLAYALYETRYLLSQPVFRATAEMDDGVRTFVTRQVIVANGSHYGTKRLAPEARVDDATLDLFAVESTSRWQGLAFFLYLAAGRRHPPDGLRHRRTSRLRLTTEPVRPVIVAGEAGLYTPIEVSVEAGALSVSVPSAFEERPSAS